MSGTLVILICGLIALAVVVGFGLGWYFRGDKERQRFKKCKPQNPESN